MSQNSIVTVVIVILAIAVGVYFYFTSGSQNAAPVYDGNATTRSIDVSHDSGSSSGSSSQPVVPPAIIDSGKASSTTSSGTSSVGGQGVPAPVIVKYNYQINIKGTVAQNSGPFIIKATDANGVSEEFTQDKLTDNSYRIESEKIFTSFSINAAGYAPVLKDNISLVERKAVIEIEMEAFGTINGDVKSFLEKPISGTSITIEKGVYKKVLHSGANGEFKLNEQIPAGQYSLSVNHPKFDSKKLVVELGKGEEKIVNIKLERDAIFEGKIVTFEGKVAAVIEGVLKHESDEKKNKEVKTDEKGLFQISNIAEGKYTLEFNSMIGTLVEPLAFARNVEMVREIKLLPPPSIGGAIVDEAGKPVVGLKIFTYDDKSMVEDTTKAEGKFNLVLVRKGNYRVLANSAEYEVINSTKLYSPSLEKIVIQVKKKAYLKGKILSPAGQPVTKDFTIRLYNKTKKSEFLIYTYTKKDNKVLIPLSTFKFISAEDDVQFIVESTTFGKGASLIMKAGSLNEENEFIVTLGD